MFSFDGDYKRTPSQHLGGVSNTNDRETLIRRAQQERQKRAEIRRQNSGASIIQATVQSFLSRSKCKERERNAFDQYIAHTGLINQENLEYLLKRILFFYYKKNQKDGERLIFLSQFLIQHPDLLLKYAMVDTQWQHRIKKLLYFCIQQLSLQNLPHAIPFRTLETFSSETIVNRYIDDPQLRHAYMEDIYKYLVKRKYFKLVRQMLEEKVPPLYDTVYQSPNSISDTLLQMIKHPLKLLTTNLSINSKYPYPVPTISSDCANLVISSFVDEILIPNYTPSIQFFVIPCLASCEQFPFLYLLKYFNELIDQSNDIIALITSSRDQYNDDEQYTVEKSKIHLEMKLKCFESTFMVNAFIQFDRLHLKYLTQNEIYMRDYIRALAQMSNNIRKLPRRSTISIFRQNNDDGSDDHSSDSDSDSNDSRRRNRLGKIDTITENEINCLLDVITALNDDERANVIVNSTKGALGEDPIILYSLGKICHNLMLYHRMAIFDYKFLYMLTFQPKFIRSLWYTLPMQSTNSGFVSPLNLIAKGIRIPDYENDRVIPMLVTFCALFGRLISSLHDGEFCQEDVLPGAISKIMPFRLPEIVLMSSFLKDISLGLVELAFPETRTSVNNHYSSALRNSLSATSSSASANSALCADLIWPHLLKVCVSLLRQLHTRDLRRGFCPENHWTVQTLNLPLEKPADLEIPRRRRGPRPFQPIKDFTKEDFGADGPPLSTKQIRSITILREIPFVVPFNTRVGIFQGLLAADRLRAQGDQQNFLQGPSIQILVRRSHLYEDAFDKLRTENEPDVRPRFRVQMINNIGLEEAGIDGGGVFREFLSELIKTAFDPNRGFFMITTDNKLYPNPSVGKIVEDYQKHYYFIGRMLGKALYENLLVELPLADFFLSKLAGKHSDVDVHQLASLDPVLHRNLLSLKAYEGDVEELGLDFTVVVDELGETKVLDLKPNGSNIPVTSSNRIEYISLMADYKLNRQIRQQCASFRKGLANVLTIEWLYMFSNKEFQVLISGAEIPVDIDDLRIHAKYGGDFESNHPTIKLFWDVVMNFNDIQRRQLLKFVTSCSRPPLLGFKDLDPPFCIQNAGDTDRLPSASTCMNLLKLPAFTSKEQLKEKLLYAIESNSGFELS